MEMDVSDTVDIVYSDSRGIACLFQKEEMAVRANYRF